MSRTLWTGTGNDLGRCWQPLFCPYSHLFPALMIKRKQNSPKKPSIPSPTISNSSTLSQAPSLHLPPFHPSLGLLPTAQRINCLRATRTVAMTMGPVQREPQVFLFGLRSRWFLNSTALGSLLIYLFISNGMPPRQVYINRGICFQLFLSLLPQLHPFLTPKKPHPLSPSQWKISRMLQCM